MSKMREISETSQNILYLRSYDARHYRGGQEAGRATNQQVLNEVDALENLAESETQESNILFGERGEAQL